MSVMLLVSSYKLNSLLESKKLVMHAFYMYTTKQITGHMLFLMIPNSITDFVLQEVEITNEVLT